ncbi:hypothetical protein H9W90_14585 [Polaribacter pectinis]|uniref:Por secretion system C-terminal sorting domain-containing protein n=1 Tax=Polaribacter pectinis TaxID=2738844 RepID=A0A7G9L9U5_9FLAO|nr:hypothetical protein [Polaribacter pectinis]QNM85394.1 hypothetical protein H9W90_14585 [Polaribacter pectinis]
MKTTIKNYIVVALMLGTLLGYANESNTSFKSIDGKRVKVEFNAVKKGNTLTIKQRNGVILYSSEIKNAGTFSKIFDLSALTSGNYIAELEKDFEIIKKSFKVENGTVIFTSDDETEFKPVIRTQNELVLISKISFSHKPVEVTIYYKDDVIYSETIVDTKEILNRVYKVSNEQKGTYRVVVNTNKKSYTQDFKI